MFCAGRKQAQHAARQTLIPVVGTRSEYVGELIRQDRERLHRRGLLPGGVVSIQTPEFLWVPFSGGVRT